MSSRPSCATPAPELDPLPAEELDDAALRLDAERAAVELDATVRRARLPVEDCIAFAPGELYRCCAEMIEAALTAHRT